MKNKLFILKSKLQYALLSLMFLVPVAAAGEQCDPTQAKLGADGKLTVCNTGVQGVEETFNFGYDKARMIVSGITGFLAIVLVAVFAWKAWNLAKTSDDPKGRAQAISGLIFFFIGAALFGAASLFVGLGYNLFR